MKDSNKEFICGLCGRTFKTLRGRSRHVYMHNPDPAIHKISEEGHQRMRKAMQKRFSKEDERRKLSERAKKNWQREDYRRHRMESSRKAYKRQDVKEKMSKSALDKWQDEEYRSKMHDSMRRAYISKLPDKAKNVVYDRENAIAFCHKLEHSLGRKIRIADLAEALDLTYMKAYNMINRLSLKEDIDFESKRVTGFRITVRSKKCKTFTLKSGWEATFAECLDKDDNVLSFSYESIAIPYECDGSMHKYYPDFVVETKAGTYIVEIKNDFLINTEVVELKRKAAELYGSKHDMTYVMIQSQQLNEYRQKVFGNCQE